MPFHGARLGRAPGSRAEVHRIDRPHPSYFMKKRPTLPAQVRRNRLARWSVAAVFASLLATSARASDLYWDADGASTTATGGTGVWTTTSTWRNGSSTGTLQSWANGNNAFFGGTAGQVQVASGSAGMSAVNLTASTDGYTLYTTSKSNGLTVTGTLALSNSVGLTLQSTSTSTSDTTFAINALSTGSSNSLTLNDSPTASAAIGSFRINLTGAGATVAAPTIITAGTNLTSGPIGYVATATGVIISGTIKNNSAATTLIGATNGNDVTLTSTAVISGSAGVQFSAGASGGSGVITLNSQSTYTGDTRFNGTSTSGYIVLGNTNALSTSSNIVMGYSSGNGQNLDLNGYSQTILSLASNGGTGAITDRGTSAGTDTLTIKGAATTSFALTIGDGSTRKIALSLDPANTGTLTLTGANTYTGATTISGGVLNLANPTGAALTGTSITVNTMGTLQMGATNQLNTATPAPVTLNGATFSVNGFSQGTKTANGVGALTLASTSANNVIDFNSKSGVVTFATFAPNGATLTINNYLNNSGTSGGPNELIFNQDQGANGTNDLGNFVFTGYGPASEQSLGGGFYEVFPTAVPEPATVLGGLLLVGALGWNQRRRLQGLVAGRPLSV